MFSQKEFVETISRENFRRDSYRHIFLRVPPQRAQPIWDSNPGCEFPRCAFWPEEEFHPQDHSQSSRHKYDKIKRQIYPTKLIHIFEMRWMHNLRIKDSKSLTVKKKKKSTSKSFSIKKMKTLKVSDRLNQHSSQNLWFWLKDWTEKALIQIQQLGNKHWELNFNAYGEIVQRE